MVSLVTCLGAQTCGTGIGTRGAREKKHTQPTQALRIFTIYTLYLLYRQYTMYTTSDSVRCALKMQNLYSVGTR